MSIERVKAYFEGYGMADRVLELPVSSATVELAAAALGCEGCRIAKTLSFLVDGATVLIVAAGDARVDNGKFKAFFHTKARMLTPQEAADLVGHAVGGVCPFALKDGVDVYLDVSMQRFETILPAAGSSNSCVELTCAELEQAACGCKGWGDFCKAWQPAEQG